MKAKTARILKWLPVILTAVAAAVVAPAVIARLFSEMQPTPAVSRGGEKSNAPGTTPVVEQRPH